MGIGTQLAGTNNPQDQTGFAALGPGTPTVVAAHPIQRLDHFEFQVGPGQSTQQLDGSIVTVAAREAHISLSCQSSVDPRRKDELRF